MIAASSSGPGARYATPEDTYSHPNMYELGDRVRRLVGGRT